MTKRMKLIVTIFVAFVIIASMLVVVCYATGVFDKNNHNTWFEPVKNGGVDDALVEQIKVGMTFSEIVEIIGKPQKDIGSGAWQMEWKLESGDKLVVSFNSTASENNEDKSVAEFIEYNLVSYHIEIRSE